jgi:hypothetical protein
LGQDISSLTLVKYEGENGVRRLWFPLFAALISASVPALLGQTPDAAQVLSSAREALGGEQKLSAVRSFTATGRTRQVRGNNLVPIEFEINCELPDKFVRKDEIPAQDTDPTTRGFSGDTLIQVPPPGAGRGGARAGGPPAGGPPPGGAPAAPAQGRAGGPPPGGGRGPGGPVPPIIAVKQDFARLMLGMFAASFPSVPLTFKYGALGEAPEGKADVLDVAGPANLSMRFVVQRDTHLPVMLMWNAPAPGQPAPAEQRMYFADYREVDGLKLPFRIRRAVGADTIEETTFDRFRINVKIDPRKFEIPK